MSGFRWYLLKHNCRDKQFHFTIVYKANTKFAKISECIKDYLTHVQFGYCSASSGTYEVKIFSEEDPYADSQHKNGLIPVNGIDEVETAQNLELQKVQNFIEYIWILLEKRNCASDDQFHLMEKSVKAFTSVDACLLDFRATSTYDRFNVSRDWCLYFEVINFGQTVK